MRTIIYVVQDPEYGDVSVYVDKSEAIEHAELFGTEVITVYEVTESSTKYITVLERDSEWEEIEE